MSHLTLETLARLIDDAPDPTETGHLDICEQCRTELEALRADASALRRLPDPEPSIAAWISLEQQLKREGLIRRSPWVQNVMRLAAVLVIFILGTVVGVRLRAPVIQQVATSSPNITTPVQTVAQTPSHIDTPVTMVNTPVTTVAQRPATNAQEAALRLQDAEKAYVTALSQYTSFNNRQDSGDPVARLAALESIVATTRAALAQSPADPVINGYHLTAVAQRDATIRQINATKQQNWY